MISLHKTHCFHNNGIMSTFTFSIMIVLEHFKSSQVHDILVQRSDMVVIQKAEDCVSEDTEIKSGACVVFISSRGLARG